MSLGKEFTIYGNMQIKICRAVVVPSIGFPKGAVLPLVGFLGATPLNRSPQRAKSYLAPQRRLRSASKR